MYFVLYDRFMKSIGETYILEKWSRTQRAIDFDDMRIVGEQIPQSANPFFVVINDKRGKQLFSGLASTPSIDDKSKKTTLSLKDYMTLFNSDIMIDWSRLDKSELNLKQYIEYILENWLNQIDIGFTTIQWNTERLAEVLWDSEEIPLGEDSESVLAYTLIKDAMEYYNIYCIPELDVFDKLLTFTFYKAGINHTSVRLKDLGIPVIEKSFGDFNRATVYDHKYLKNQEWALTEDNSVVKLPSDKPLVYPAKNRNFIAEEPSEDLTEQQALWNAIYDAVFSLSANRYQENIDIDVHSYAPFLDLSHLDFSYTVGVYAENNLYKNLPVGEIETDSNGKYIVRLGHRVQQLTQEV